MGIEFVPQRLGDRLTVRAASPTLLLPTEAGVLEVTTGGTSQLVDRATFVLVPAGARASLEAKSPVVHTLALAVKPALVASVARTYAGEIERSHLERYLATTHFLPRTNWMNEIGHRYLFERAVCKKRDNDATRFLETEIVKEVYFLCREREVARDRRSIVEGPSPLVQRALQVLEESLFDGNVVPLLAARCGASASTLLRAFKRELGQAPLAYVRARRLDESLLLLKSKRFTVSEIATMVGYKNFAAFSHAFRARFGRRPSEVRERGG